MRKLVVVLAFLAAGCDQRLDRLLDKLAGHETNTVVLANKPIVIEANGMTLQSTEPMLVVGKSSYVCMVLRTGVPLAPQPTMDNLYKEAMHGASVTATLKMKNGKVFKYSQPGQAWDKYGHISSGDEVSACFSCGCGPTPTIGSQVGEVTIASSPPLKVLGVYWESTNAFDQITGN